jgi:hypothetical protein
MFHLQSTAMIHAQHSVYSTRAHVQVWPAFSPSTDPQPLWLQRRTRPNAYDTQPLHPAACSLLLSAAPWRVVLQSATKHYAERTAANVMADNNTPHLILGAAAALLQMTSTPNALLRCGSPCQQGMQSALQHSCWHLPTRHMQRAKEHVESEKRTTARAALARCG